MLYLDSGEKYFSSDSISSQEYDLTGQRHEEVLSFFRPRRSIITSITSLDNYNPGNRREPGRRCQTLADPCNSREVNIVLADSLLPQTLSPVTFLD